MTGTIGSRRLVLVGSSLTEGLLGGAVHLLIGGTLLWIALGADQPVFLLGGVFFVVGAAIIGRTPVTRVDLQHREVRQTRFWTLGLRTHRYGLDQFSEVTLSPTWDNAGGDGSIVRAYAVSLAGGTTLEVARYRSLTKAQPQAEAVASWLGWSFVDKTTSPARRVPSHLVRASMTDRLASMPAGEHAPNLPASSVVVVRQATSGETTVEFPGPGIAWRQWSLALIALPAVLGVLSWEYEGSLPPTTTGFVVLLLIVLASGLTLRQVLLAPLRFRLSASPSFVVVSRITLWGEWHRRIPNARIKDVVLQGETLVIITDRRRIELGIKARNRTLYRDLPTEQQLEIRSGQSTFPSSADAQFVYHTLRHGLIGLQPASDRSRFLE